MFTYQYLQSDFIADSNVTQLHELSAEITALSLASATLISVSSSGSGVDKIVDVVFSVELSAGDKTALDDLVAAYVDPSDLVSCSIKDIKPPGTNGGTFTKDIWTTRDLNTIEGVVSYLTLASNQVTIIPGSYSIRIQASACNVESHQIRLRNITEGSYILGTNAFASNGVMDMTILYENIIFTETTVFDIQHICSKTAIDIGFGRASGFDVSEIYTTINIEKLD